jgi:tetratricopeptide (TPR) repeat protein
VVDHQATRLAFPENALMDPKIKQDLAFGREHYDAGEYEEAYPHLLRVLEAHDGFADVHNMLGVIAYQRGKADESALRFQKAVDINPRYNEAALNLSVVLNELGRYDEAKSVYESMTAASNASPGSVDELDGFVRGKIANLHAKVAEAYQAVGLYEPSIKELRTALELCPTFVDLRSRLGTALRDAGLLDESISELEGVRDGNPKYAQGRIRLGLSYWAAGRKDEATSEWKQAAELDPDNTSCRAYLAMAERE